MRRLAAILLLAACRPPAEPDCGDCLEMAPGPAPPAPTDLAAETRRWHDERIAGLRGDTSWLTLAGLWWLDEGEHRLGSAETADLVFPAGAPAQIGTLTRTGREIRLRLAPGVDARIGDDPITDRVLRSDADPTQPADRVQLGERFTLLILARGDRLGVRLYDRDAATRREFTGVPTFPVSDAWRVTARLEPFPQPRKIDHPTVLGTAMPADSPGVVVFTVAGREHRLTPILERGPHGQELLFVFRDLTSGKQTYAGGRFLVAELPAPDNTVVLDFNRAHNPPCAFTPYATCPVPLPENRLAIPIDAGEQTPAGH